MQRSKSKFFALVLLAILLLILPVFFTSNYYYRVGALILINAVAVTGLVILVGYAGQISLGHAGFSGIGAYACALSPVYLGLSPAVSVLLGALCSAAIAWLIGRPILKLQGYYLAVATLGFGLLVFMVLVNESAVTGGPDGIRVEALGVVSLVKSMGLKLKTSQVWYWLSCVVFLLGALLALNLYDSRTGRALRCLHNSEVAASSIGIDVAKFKLIAFVISAVYASIAGSMLALLNRFINPDIAGFLHSIELVTMTILGGASSVFGGLLGSGLLTGLPQALTVFHEYEHIILGLIMMLVMIFMPGGLVSGVNRLIRRTE